MEICGKFVGENWRSPKAQINSPSSCGKEDSMLTIEVFLLPFLHISGLIEHVAEDVNQVKDITKNINDKMKEGFDRMEGTYI